MWHLVPLIQLFSAEPAPADPTRQRQGSYEVALMLPPDGLYAEQEMEIEFRVLDVETPGSDGSVQPLRRARIRVEAVGGRAHEVAHPHGIAVTRLDRAVSADRMAFENPLYGRELRHARNERGRVE